MLERILQGREIADSILLDHDLAVDQRGVDRKFGERVGDRLEFVSPVERLAGEQRDLSVVEPRLQAVAIELRLMHIGRVIRCFLVQGRKLRRHEGGEGVSF